MSSQPKPYLQIPECHRALAAAGYRKILLLTCFSLLTLTVGVTDGASVEHSLGKKEQDLTAYVTDREQEDVHLPVQNEDELTAQTKASLPRYHRILAPTLKSSEHVSQGEEMKNAATVSDAYHKTRDRDPNLQVLTESDSKIPRRERPWKAKSKLEGTMLRTPTPPTQTEARGTGENSRPFSGAERADIATETQKPDENSQGQDTAEDGSFPQKRRNPGRKDATSGDGSHQRRLLTIKPLRRRTARRNLGSTRIRRRRSSERLMENHETNSEQIHQAQNLDEEDNDESSNDDYRGYRTSQDAYVQGDPGMSSMHSPHEGEERHGGSNIYTENLFAAALALHKNTDIDEEKAWDDVMSRLHDPTTPVTRPGSDDSDLVPVDENAASIEPQYVAYSGSAENTRNKALGSSSATDEHNAGKFQFEKVQQVNSASDDVDEEEINLAHKVAVPEHFESTERYRDSLSSGSQSGSSDPYGHKSYMEEDLSSGFKATEGSGVAQPFPSADLSDSSVSSVHDPYPNPDRPFTSDVAYHWVPEGSRTQAADSYHDTSSDTDDEEAAHVRNKVIISDEEEEPPEVTEKLANLANADSSVESDESDVDDLVDRGHTYTDNTDTMELDVEEHHTNEPYGSSSYSAAMPNTNYETYVDDAIDNSANSLDGHTRAAQNEGNYLRSAVSHEQQAMASSDSSQEESAETMTQDESSAIFDEPSDVAYGVAGEHHAEGRNGLLEGEPQFKAYSQGDINQQMRLHDNDGHLQNLAESKDRAMAYAYSEEHPYGNAIWPGEGGDSRLEYADHRNDYNELGDTHQNWGSPSHYEAAEETADHSNVADDESDDSSLEEHETDTLWSSSNLQEHPKQVVDYTAMGHDSEPAEVTAAHGNPADSSAQLFEDEDEDGEEERKEFMGMTSHASVSAPSDVAWGLSGPPAYYENDHKPLTSNHPTSAHTTQNYRRKESTHR